MPTFAADDAGSPLHPVDTSTIEIESGAKPFNARQKLRTAMLAVRVVGTHKKVVTEGFGSGDGGDEDERDNLTTPWGTVRSLINCFVSAGVLGLAFQMKQAGSGTTSLLLVFSAYLIYMTMMFLYDASVYYKCTGYVQTVETAVSTRVPCKRGSNTGSFFAKS